jgi:hypothetical protein
MTVPDVSSALEGPAVTGRTSSRPAWLLLLHQLPAHPTSLRVRTWRRLQQVGAIAVKNAVHALPDSQNSREDFEWLRTEITTGGGDATVFVAETIDGWAHEALVDEFRRAREQAYARLAKDLDATTRRRRKRPTGRSMTAATIERFRQRLAGIEQIDFFGSAGRDGVLKRLTELERLVHGDAARPTGPESRPAKTFAGRVWVTRPRPGVDRMASAWLIRRFIDPDARFEFVREPGMAGDDAVPFDMFGVEFTHRGESCTFEVLCAEFQLAGGALTRIAALVHDLDLKDQRFGAPEAATVGTVIDGLRLAHADDQVLLSSGMSLFEALYLQFSVAHRPTGPTPVSRSQGGARHQAKRKAPTKSGRAPR